MTPIRILQVFTIMNRGGAESMIMNYYRNIDREKIQFDFLVHRKSDAAFDNEIKDLGGRIFKFEAINPFFPGSYYKKLRKFFKEHSEYKIVHSHLNAFSSFPLKIAQEFNIPCRIAHAHIAIDSVSLKTIQSYKEGPKEILKKVLKNRLKNNIHNYSTHQFSCGNKAGEWLFGENSNFHTMNNAIDTKKFVFNSSLSEKLRKQYNIENNLVIGHVGRFTNQKNHSFLLKIFNEVLKEKPNSVLVLIGNGPLRNEIEDEATNLGIKNKIQFLGVRENVYELFQMIDICVFPSFYEGLPVTLIEAQAAGVKTLGSDAITTEVAITDDIDFLPLENSAKKWAEKIINISDYQKKNNLRSIVDAQYDIKKNVAEIEAFYLEQY